MSMLLIFPLPVFTLIGKGLVVRKTSLELRMLLILTLMKTV